MRIRNYKVKVFYFLAFILMVDGCVEKIEDDPCLETKWPQSKELEIKLAVRIMPTNPPLPGGSPGSQDPVDFKKMVVSGTIEKVDCYKQKSGVYNLGNSYITKGYDLPAPFNEPEAFWIGHIVYVYLFEGDRDHLNINITVKITMNDDQSYMCNASEAFYCPDIELVPGEMYYYILLDIDSDNWIKV